MWFDRMRSGFYISELVFPVFSQNRKVELHGGMYYILAWWGPPTNLIVGTYFNNLVVNFMILYSINKGGVMVQLDGVFVWGFNVKWRNMICSSFFAPDELECSDWIFFLSFLVSPGGLNFRHIIKWLQKRRFFVDPFHGD